MNSLSELLKNRQRFLVSMGSIVFFSTVLLSIQVIFGRAIGFKLATKIVVFHALAFSLIHCFSSSKKMWKLAFFNLLMILAFLARQKIAFPLTVLDVFLLFFVFILSCNLASRAFYFGLLWVLAALSMPVSYFFYYSRIPLISEMSLIPEVLGFLSWPGALGLVLAVVFFSVITLYLVLTTLLRYKKRCGVFFAAGFILVVGMYMNVASIDRKLSQYSEVRWDVVDRFGYYPTLIWFEIRRLKMKRAIASSKVSLRKTALEDRFDKKWKKKPNIHFILLESFVDYSRFSGENFKNLPVDSFFSRALERATVIDVPVFGGLTAQSEFEALCGVPAKQSFGPVEFEHMNEGRAPCLPAILKSMGYQTVATSPWGPGQFNIGRAYKAMGFDQTHLSCRGCKSSYLKKLSHTGENLTDEELFAANERYLKEEIETPYFNYVVTGYGHYPYPRNIKRRPQLWNGSKNDLLVRSVNQFIYRSLSLSHWLKSVSNDDPQAVMILFGDHLAVLNDSDVYERNHYLGGGKLKSLALIFIGQKIYSFQNIKLYHLAYLLSDLIQGRFECNDGVCSINSPLVEDDDYMRIISQAVQ